MLPSSNTTRFDFSHYKRIIVTIVLLVQNCIVYIVSAQAQSLTESDPFFKSTSQRQSRLKSIDVTFLVKEYRPKGSSIPMAVKSDQILRNNVSIESTNRIVIQDDNLLRIESNHSAWHAESSIFVPIEKIAVSNTNESRSFYPKGRGTDPQPSGSIRSSSSTNLFEYFYQPITLFSRGLNRHFVSPTIHSFKPTGIQQRINGNNCLEYVAQLDRNLKRSLYIIPHFDYAVSRITLIRQNKIVEQIDISFVRDEQSGMLFPDSWIEHYYSMDGKLIRQTECKVLSRTINKALPANHFDIQFPVGTRVFVAKEDNYYRVQPDGSYLLLSRSAEELPYKKYYRESWKLAHYFGIFLAICLVGLIISLIVRFRVRNTTKEPR